MRQADKQFARKLYEFISDVARDFSHGSIVTSVKQKKKSIYRDVIFLKLFKLYPVYIKYLTYDTC